MSTSGVKKPETIACGNFFFDLLALLDASIWSPFTLSTVPVASTIAAFSRFVFFLLAGGSIRLPGLAAGSDQSSCRIFFSGSCMKRLKGIRRMSPSRVCVPAGKWTRNLPDVPNAPLISPISPWGVTSFIPKNGFNSVSFLNNSSPNTSYLTIFSSSCRLCGSPRRKTFPCFSFGVYHRILDISCFGSIRSTRRPQNARRHDDAGVDNSCPTSADPFVLPLLSTAASRRDPMTND
mmetsp:Transcript_34560/g.83455  ORF Transcript_34560/g.83455 Transcript_34560/m.83455 type:complete len:235 (-) Transcript_34560:1746-2450(-)